MHFVQKRAKRTIRNVLILSKRCGYVFWVNIEVMFSMLQAMKILFWNHILYSFTVNTASATSVAIKLEFPFGKELIWDYLVKVWYCRHGHIPTVNQVFAVWFSNDEEILIVNLMHLRAFTCHSERMSDLLHSSRYKNWLDMLNTKIT